MKSLMENVWVREVLNKIYPILIFISLGFVRLMLRVYFANKKITAHKDVIDEVKKKHDIKVILKRLGRNDVIFPIIIFGGEWVDPSYIQNYQDFEDSNYITEGEYIIDADGKKYNISKAKNSELGINEIEYQEYDIFEQVDFANQIYSFEEIKSIFWGNTTNDLTFFVTNVNSVYYEYKEEIDKSQNMQELTNIMSKAD